MRRGTPCWVSLVARDLDTAEHFYGPLLGWEFIPGSRSSARTGGPGCTGSRWRGSG